VPTSNPYKENLLEILANWRQNLELRDNLSVQEQEDIMNLSPAYLKQREEWKLEGRQEGRQEEAANLVLRQLARRFGEVPQNLAHKIRELPIEDVETLGEALLDFQRLSDLVSWLER
jgi:predicted transposase YdaD